ncbi:cytochrome P450 [Streptomyces sp. MBT65]|uniref:cytochrome P450 n=1 Tax=Streptomyces sp. MBT65 TaxID=1488395 RepID=UPI00190BF6B7|nr:cytochrome P450 [Streptomyces sp. MBT65]MBK3577537.1 cytochrome P450 [Streptomyces sp. MBT65]
MKSSGTRQGYGDAARTPRGVLPRVRDPLTLLGAEFDGVHDVWRSTAGTVCVAGPQAARAVLGNRDGTVVDMSDFYRTRHGDFGPRAAQIRIGRSARALMRRHLDARRPELPGLVAELLTPSAVWPDAGNLLVLRHLRDVLVHPDAPPRLHATVEQIVRRSVLAGARRRHSPASRLLFRRRALSVLHGEVRARRRELTGPRDPRDLLDVVVGESEPGADPKDLAEVYLSFLFAAVGSVGFALGWSVYLLGTHPDSPAAKPSWVVREALRLWPVAWLFARTPSRAQDLGGTAVTPRDRLAVCTYLVHRHPGYWERPDEFVPERWAQAPPDPAYLPFGHGPHTCAGATVTMRLLEDLVELITRDRRLTVTHDGAGPQVGPALAPPRFTAVLSARTGCPGRR